MVREILCVLGGFAVGAGSTYILMKKKYEIVIREEVAAAIEWAESKNNKTDEADGNDKEVKEEISHEADVNEYNKLRDDIMGGDDEKLEANRPYIIPEEDYIVDDEDYEKVTLDYYTDPGELYEGDEYIPNVDEIVGEDNLSLLHGGPDDVLYIRNESHKIDYEVCKIAGRYTDFS